MLLQAENCVLLGHYAASSGNLIPTFRGQLIGLIFKGNVLDLGVG